MIERPLTFTQAGSGNTVTVTRHALSGPYLQTGTSDPFTVTAAALHHFVLSEVGTQSAGHAFSVTATAKDSFGNTVTSFTGPGTVAAVNSACTAGCSSVSGFTGGVKTFSVTLTTATSSAKITVTSAPATGSKTGATNTFTVNPAALDHFTLGAVAQQTAGTSFNVQAAAKDAFGNTVTSYTGPAMVSALNTTCSAGCTNVTFSGGLKTFSVTVTHTSATAQIKVTGSSKTGTSNMFTVVAGAPKALVFTSAETPLGSGAPRSLTVQVQDANGNLVPTSSSLVTFSQIGGTGTVSGLGSSAAVAGTATKPILGALKGPITIRATATGLTPDTTAFTITPGAPKKLDFTSATTPLQSGAKRTLTVQIEDAAGNVVPVNAPVSFVQISGTGSLVGVSGTVIANAGIASRQVTGLSAGPVLIRATSSSLVPDTSGFSVTPGAASKLVFTSPASSVKIGQTKTLTAEVRDAADNKVTSPAVTVTFERTAGTGTVTFLGGANAGSVNGVASKTIQATHTGSITVRARSGALTPALATFTITS